MKINLDAVFATQVTYADIVHAVQHTDLYSTTDEFFAVLGSLLDKASDATVLFVPRDSAAADQSEQGWTLSHILAHLTATLEEAAAMAAMLARGVQVEGRLRTETPWEKLSTIQLVQSRVKESQRICHAFLDAWPDEPHLDVTMTLIPRFGPMNAIGFYVFGLAHGQGHLEQLRDTVHQYISSEGL